MNEMSGKDFLRGLEMTCAYSCFNVNFRVDIFLSGIHCFVPD